MLFRGGFFLDPEDESAFRCFRAQTFSKKAQMLFFSGRGDFDDAATVSYKTGNAGLFGEAGYKRPIPDPLYNSENRKENGHTDSKLTIYACVGAEASGFGASAACVGAGAATGFGAAATGLSGLLKTSVPFCASGCV